MTGASGPLGRDSVAFREKMEKYHAAMENALYAAEQACQSSMVGCGLCAEGCPFDTGDGCGLDTLRDILGDHIIQHDCMVPPCQCAGDTGEGTVRE
jgi:ferredoxin